MTSMTPEVVLLGSAEETGTGTVPRGGAAPWSPVLRKRNRGTEGSQGVHMAQSEGLPKGGKTVNLVHREVGAGGVSFQAKSTASTGLSC